MDTLSELLRRTTQPGFADALTRWLRGRGLPLPQSLPGYAFDRYKRARRRAHPAGALNSLRFPGQPGLASVVLPVYNGAQYLAEALDSLLAQTYPHWECIAVDDGSTDGSGDLLDSYAARDARIRAVHQPNRGLPRALSRGFRLARGQFQTWTSCDNRLKANFLEALVGDLQRHPDWDMLFANQALIGPEGEPLQRSPYFRTYQRPRGSPFIHLPEDVSELNTRPNNTLGAAFLLRDRVTALLGDHNPRRFTVEDYDYWMRVNALFTLRHAETRAPLYEYRFHPQSLTAREKELAIEEARARLLVWDDFRRDFYLTPLAWTFLPTPADPVARDTARRLEARALAAGHRVPERSGPYRPAEIPHLFQPWVAVQVTTDPTAQPSPDLPPGALRVLLVCGPAPLSPAEEPDGWDVRALAAPGGAHPPAGWIVETDPRLGGLFSAIDIRARMHALEAIEALAAGEEPAGLQASVVICTHLRNEAVVRAVESAARQEFPTAGYEVIVVDNRPTDDRLKAAVGRLREEYFGGQAERLRLVACPEPGLSHARNAALSVARGEVVAFLDDDALAEPGWLRTLCGAFREHPRAGVIGGPVVLQPPEPRPAVLRPGFEKYWSQFLPGGSAYRAVRHAGEFPWGANWAARRTALLQVGGFRTGYGRKGKSFASHEELVAAWLVQRLGYEVGVEPRAVVRHCVDPARYTWRHVRSIIRAGILGNLQASLDGYFPQAGLSAAPSTQVGRRLPPARILLYHGLARIEWMARRAQHALARLRRPAA